ncbi:hypothetical protein FRB90_004649 [Tulasnella sp. 427]|nr:hypothetical protein FRB90_004649 [Tulasnella sp. 427]
MAAVIASSLPSNAALIHSYENNEPPPVDDPMRLTIEETTEKMNELVGEQTAMGNRIEYLRGIRARALALLAEADVAEVEANQIEAEKDLVDREVNRLQAVVERMSEMWNHTKKLTDKMRLDTSLQMAHLLTNGKTIVPRMHEDVSPPSRTKSPIDSPAMINQASSASPATSSSATKFSPGRQLSLTPGSSVAPNYAALAASEAAVSRQSLAGAQQPADAKLPGVTMMSGVPAMGNAISASPGSNRVLHSMTPPTTLAGTAMSAATLAGATKTEPGLPVVTPPIGYALAPGVLSSAVPLSSTSMSTGLSSSHRFMPPPYPPGMSNNLPLSHGLPPPMPSGGHQSLPMGSISRSVPTSLPMTMSNGVPNSLSSTVSLGMPTFASPPVAMYGGASGTVMANGVPQVPMLGGGGGVGMYPTTSTMFNQKDDEGSKAQFAADADEDDDVRARNALYR